MKENRYFQMVYFVAIDRIKFKKWRNTNGIISSVAFIGSSYWKYI